MNAVRDPAAFGRPYDNDFLGRVVLPWLGTRPDRLVQALRLASRLHLAEQQRRRAVVRHQVAIPETLVLGLTSACDLRCPACSERERRDGPRQVLPGAVVCEVLDECRRLGIGRVALVGGEPLLYPQLDELLAGHPDLFFAIFTNGRSANDERLAGFGRLANAAFFVNVSAGGPPGPVAQIQPGARAALERFVRAGLLVGFAATVHRDNLALFSQPGTYAGLSAAGARFGMLFDYLPGLSGLSGPDPLVVTEAGRRALVTQARQAAVRLDLALLFAPEDEAAFGGCGAAGRGLVYLGPDGRIGPCPFAPASRAQVGQSSLLEALQSPFFQELRVCVGGREGLGHGCSLRTRQREYHEIGRRHGVLVRPS